MLFSGQESITVSMTERQGSLKIETCT